MERLIAEGAEAKIYLSNQKIIKERIPKSYRHPSIDIKLRKSRTKREAKILEKAAQANISVPSLIKQDSFNIELEYIDAKPLAKTLNSFDLKKQKTVLEQLGLQVAKLHDVNIIHGDLTTSNVLFDEKDLFIIDFGLGVISTKIEDKAVDIHLLKQALNAKHFKNHEILFEAFLSGYNAVDKQKVLERLIAVEKRGRYRH